LQSIAKYIYFKNNENKACKESYTGIFLSPTKQVGNQQPTNGKGHIMELLIVAVISIAVIAGKVKVTGYL